MNQLLATLKRGLVVLREEGPIEFGRRAREYLRRVDVSSDGITVSYQTGTRVDFEDRWKLLETQLEDDKSVLDIGCAEGHLTARFAKNGLLSIGIERQTHTVAAARKSNAKQPNLGFLEYEITPETIDSIPSVDVILLLAVYHHWDREFGWEAADEMLRTLGSKCDRLLFEIPERQMDRPPVSDRSFDTNESLIEYYTLLLQSVYSDEVEVEFLDRTDYKGGERDDLIFAIDFTETV